MSHVCSHAVFFESQSKGSARLVLLAMADEANDEGLLTAYRRSHSHLGRKANVDASTVKRALAALVALGEVEVLTVGIGRASSDYRIVLPTIERGQDEPSQQSRGGEVHPQRAQDDPSEGAQVPPPSSRSFPVLSLTDLCAEVPDLFDAFWDEYPRKVEKQTARKRWQAQVKRGADPRDLVAAGTNYARAKRGTPPDKIKHAATFLGPDDVWRDWLDGGAALAEAEQAQWDVSYGPEVVEF